MGDAHHSLKNNVESDKNYDNALRIDPNNVIVLNNYSYYLSLRNEDLEKAKRMSAKSNNLAPNQASFQDTFAWILFQLKEYEEADVWITKAINNSAQPSGVILEHKGDILFHIGQIEEALKYWEKAKIVGGASEQINKKITDKRYHD